MTDDRVRRGSVAIVITTYNHAQFLASALRSAVSQTRPAAEIIVVDDGSTDDPEAVTRTFAGVRLIRQPNAGLAAARNTGWRAATSEFVVPRSIPIGRGAAFGSKISSRAMVI